MSIEPKKTTRPWGEFIKFISNSPCTVKILKIKKGEALSLQSHKLREEFWYLISGKIKVKIGKSQENIETKILNQDDSIFIEKEILHNAEALEHSQILEISLGKFDEDDEIRFEDRYGRN